MAKIKTLGTAAFLQSDVTEEQFKRLKAFKPEALVLKDEETKKDIFSIDTTQDKGSISDYGVIFSEVKDGKLALTIQDACLKPDKKEYIKENYGQALGKLNALEKQIAKEYAKVEKDLTAIEANIEVD